MPGSPHMRRGVPLAERSAWNIVKVFIVFPVLAGGGLLTWVIVHAARQSSSFTTQDWLFQVVLMGGLGLGVMLALPAVGIAELRMRRRPKSDGNREVGEQEPRS